jgi:cytochrome c
MDRLVGGRDTLASTSPVKTVGSYWPYATTLYDYIYRAMPFDAPQSLTADEVYAVTAWLLHENGITEADTVIDARALPQIPCPTGTGLSQTRDRMCVVHNTTRSTRGKIMIG